MYHNSSLRTFLRTTLVCSLLTVGLLVVGCDSGGSNGGSGPDWAGNWKETDNNGNATFAISFSKSKVKSIDRTNCNVETSNVTNVSSGNEVTVESGPTTRTQKLVVLDNGNMEVRNPSDGNVFVTYQPADNDKSVEEITGCT
jgi:hypothetical protein